MGFLYLLHVKINFRITCVACITFLLDSAALLSNMAPSQAHQGPALATAYSFPPVFFPGFHHLGYLSICLH